MTKIATAKNLEALGAERKSARVYLVPAHASETVKAAARAMAETAGWKIVERGDAFIIRLP